MPCIARFWDALPRFGQPPSCKQPGMCSENSGLRHAISELVQRSGKALQHGLEPRLESLALRLGRIDWKPARCELRAALVLGESADTGRNGKPEVIQKRVRGDHHASHIKLNKDHASPEADFRGLSPTSRAVPSARRCLSNFRVARHPTRIGNL